MARAPPSTLTFSGSSSVHSLTHERACAAKASLISTKSTSAHDLPARASAWLAASTGATPKMLGSLAVTPRPMIRARGSPRLAFSLPMSSADAPSLSGLELPAVTVPPSRWKAGLRSASDAVLVSARMLSSMATSAPGTCTIWLAKNPVSHDCAARACDRAAKASWASREISYRSARISADWPLLMVQRSSIFLLTMRHPSVDE